MSHTRKSEDKKRTVVVRARITPMEKKWLEEKAEECGLTLSDWIRKATMNAKPLHRKPSPDREIMLKLLAALGQSGNNLNQLMRHLNQQKDFQSLAAPVATVTGTVESVRAVSEQIRNALGHGD